MASLIGSYVFGNSVLSPDLNTIPHLSHMREYLVIILIILLLLPIDYLCRAKDDSDDNGEAEPMPKVTKEVFNYLHIPCKE